MAWKNNPLFLPSDFPLRLCASARSWVLSETGKIFLFSRSTLFCYLIQPVIFNTLNAFYLHSAFILLPFASVEILKEFPKRPITGTEGKHHGHLPRLFPDRRPHPRPAVHDRSGISEQPEQTVVQHAVATLNAIPTRKKAIPIPIARKARNRPVGLTPLDFKLQYLYSSGPLR